MLLEVLVVVLVENIVVTVFPIKLDRIIDLAYVYSRLAKLFRAYTSYFLVLQENDRAIKFFQNVEYNYYTTPIVSADALQRHNFCAVLAHHNSIHLLFVNSIEVSNEQNWM